MVPLNELVEYVVLRRETFGAVIFDGLQVGVAECCHGGEVLH